jgi:hydrogenase maturation protease
MASSVRRESLVIIGVGNPYRADDGIGPLVAARLAVLPGARVISRDSDAFTLIEEWTGVDTAVLIDAAAAISTPGRIHRIDLSSDELPCELGIASTHAFGVANAVALGRALDRMPRRLVIYAVEGVCFDPGASMTAEVAAAAAEVAGLVLAEVACRDA